MSEMLVRGIAASPRSGLQLRSRLSLSIAAILLLILSIATALVVQQARSSASRETVAELALAGRVVDSLIAEAAGDDARLSRALAALPEMIQGARHLCVEIDGRNAAVSCMLETPMQVPDWFRRAVAEPPILIKRRVETSGGRVYVLSLAGDPARELEESWNGAKPLLILLVVLAAASNALVFWALTRALSPIGQLSQALRRIGEGNLAPLPRFDGPGELALIYAEVGRLRDQLAVADDLARSLRARALEAQEAERRHIARELHDEVGQCVTALEADLAVIRGRGGDELFDQACASAQLSAGRIAESVQLLLGRLHPAVLDALGLPAALEQLACDWRKRAPEMRVELLWSGGMPDLEPEARLHLYRIAQEGLTNAVRHARASRIQVLVTYDQAAAKLRLEISDDGRGLPPRHSPGLGLAGMRERARAIRGELHIYSSPHCGVSLEVSTAVSAKCASSVQGGYKL